MPNKTKRLVMVIDLDHCIGCWTCATACKAENNVSLGNWWSRVLSPETTGHYYSEPGTGPDGQPVLSFLPIACQHCENAPCVRACPTGATHKRPDGITAQDYSLCIGCRTCMSACPYNARVFNWRDPQVVAVEGEHIGNAAVPVRSKNVVEKCTFCQERIDQGQIPACVEACPTVARHFGDLNDPNSEVARLIRERGGKVLKEEFGTHPSVFYLPSRRKETLLASERSKSGGTIV